MLAGGMRKPAFLLLFPSIHSATHLCPGFKNRESPFYPNAEPNTRNLHTHTDNHDDILVDYHTFKKLVHNALNSNELTGNHTDMPQTEYISTTANQNGPQKCTK